MSHSVSFPGEDFGRDELVHFHVFGQQDLRGRIRQQSDSRLVSQARLAGDNGGRPRRGVNQRLHHRVEQLRLAHGLDQAADESVSSGVRRLDGVSTPLIRISGRSRSRAPVRGWPRPVPVPFIPGMLRSMIAAPNGRPAADSACSKFHGRGPGGGDRRVDAPGAAAARAAPGIGSGCRPRSARGSRAGLNGCVPGHRPAAAVRRVNQNVEPLPGFAFHADLAAHQFRQLLADGQPQPGAAELAGDGRVHLREAFEQPVEPFGRDADAGVADGESHLDVAGVAGIGAFDGVRHVETRTTTSPREVNLMALLTRFISTWRSRSPSPRHVRRDAGSTWQASSSPLADGFLGAARPSTSSTMKFRSKSVSSSSSLPASILEKSRIWLISESRASEEDLMTWAYRVCWALSGGVQEQLDHPDHAVERRADFVAHVGQEIALGVAGGFGGGAGGLGFLLGAVLLGLGPLPLRDVLDRPFVIEQSSLSASRTSRAFSLIQRMLPSFR